MSNYQKKRSAFFGLLGVVGLGLARGATRQPTPEPTPEPNGNGGEDMWINRPLQRWLNKHPKRFTGIEFSKRIQDAPELEIEKIQAVYNMNHLIRMYAHLSSGVMDISAAVGSYVPHPSFNPWPGTSWRRRGMAFHVTWVVYDVTIANTQLVYGHGPALANVGAMTLPGTSGWAGPVDFVIPPDFYVGLTTTGDAGDNSRDLSIIGYYEEIGPNGFDWGGFLTFTDYDLEGTNN